MKKILIVDDELHIRLLLQQTLEDVEEEGVLLLTADNGEDALETIAREGPQLVFLDVMMPGLNGFEVCDAVKHALGMTGVYIVMLTAKGQVFDRRQGLDVGADIYMTNPFNPDEILKMARGILKI